MIYADTIMVAIPRDYVEHDCGEEGEVKIAAARRPRSHCVCGSRAVLHEVRPYRRRGLSHDKSANNRGNVWWNGK